MSHVWAGIALACVIVGVCILSLWPLGGAAVFFTAAAVDAHYGS